MAYTKINYRNGQTPSISAENLNHTEQGVYDNAEAIDEINETSLPNIIQRIAMLHRDITADAYSGSHDVTVYLDFNHRVVVDGVVTSSASLGSILAPFRPADNVYFPVVSTMGIIDNVSFIANVTTSGAIYVMRLESGAPPTYAPVGTPFHMEWYVDLSEE